MGAPTQILVLDRNGTITAVPAAFVFDHHQVRIDFADRDALATKGVESPDDLRPLEPRADTLIRDLLTGADLIPYDFAVILITGRNDRDIGEALIRRALEYQLPREPPPASIHHASLRWASAVVPLLDVSKDPKTLQQWARCIAASPGAIRNWCRTANLRPRSSLLFARLLRVVLRHNDQRLNPAESLDIVDRRTLAKVLRLGGLEPDNASGWPTSVEAFVERQRLIDTPEALAAFKKVWTARKAAMR